MQVCRWFAACLAAALGVCAERAAPQEAVLAASNPSTIEAAHAALPIIREIEFTGLRRISPKAIRAQIETREGMSLDPSRIEADVRVLARLGWFRDIRVQVKGMQPLSGTGGDQVQLTYHLEEAPFLTKTDFAGSRLLSREQIEKILDEKGIVPRTGEPANDAELCRAGLIILDALRQLGRPGPRIQMEKRESANGTVEVRYVIDDGPKIAVGRIAFQGNVGLTEKELRAEMKEIVPGGWFAGLRGKNVFTQEAFESDRQSLLNYYQNHGYPDARIGWAATLEYGESSRRWLPWPHRERRTRQAVTIPVEAGKFYRFSDVRIDEKLRAQAKKQSKNLALSGQEFAGKPYSAQAVEQLRRAWFARVNPKAGKATWEAYRGVDASRTFDPVSGTASVRVELSDKPPVMVQRIEFRGLHKFKDKYVRRRLVLQEGNPLDERALEAGLARLTRTGYFRPVKREDVRVEVNEERRTASVTLQMHEIGQQRISLTGGQSEFGGTLGLVYAVFDLLNREELLSAQMEGGPQSALLALGLAKDGFLASRGSLAVSLFDNVLRPRLGGTVKGPFYRSRNEGVSAGWNYTVSSSDAFGVNYAITRNITRYSLDVPEGLTGIVPSEIRAKTDSRSVGFGWTHDLGKERRVWDGSVSGGWLGGNENVVRSSGEYARIARDPLFDKQNAWAFRVYARGAGSYSGDMPPYARIFAGDELVRGLRLGELGPYGVTSMIDATGAAKYSAAPAGANLVTAANAEYRVPLRDGLQAAGFFDLGSGVLLPNWLGQARPTVLSATNGALHGSTGIELSWTVPGVHIPVRTYYAFNVLRLNRFVPLPDGTHFHAHDCFSAFGWAIGSLF
jgi:outer membrane protein assembly complex protein YaeT